MTQFEVRSVQLIAACTLGLAGMASAQIGPPTRQAATAASSTSRQADAPRPAHMAATTVRVSSHRDTEPR